MALFGKIDKQGFYHRYVQVIEEIEARNTQSGIESLAFIQAEEAAHEVFVSGHSILPDEVAKASRFAQNLDFLSFGKTVWLGIRDIHADLQGTPAVPEVASDWLHSRRYVKLYPIRAC